MIRPVVIAFAYNAPVDASMLREFFDLLTMTS